MGYRFEKLAVLLAGALLVAASAKGEPLTAPPSERAAARPGAAPVIWFHDAAGRLGAVDLADGSVRDLGPLGVVLTDIAFAPDGRLYGLSFDQLYEIDRRRGAVRLIGRHGVPCANAPEIAPSGEVYAMGCSTGALYGLDLETGRSRRLAMLPYPSSGDLAFREGGLLLSARGYGAVGGDVLVAIDLDALQAEVIGAMGQEQVYGLVADRGLGVFAGAGRRYFQVDPRTGALLELGRIGSERFVGVFGWAIEPMLEAPFV